jgi:hypothetical protein
MPDRKDYDVPAETRHFTDKIVVKCPVTLCDKSEVLSVKQRNDPKFTGLYCDGKFGERHPAVMMKGPNGKAYE